MKRKIIEIDEAKCTGCGLCIPGCKEGALQIVDGKAKLVADVYCDGLGACLGECPQGALQVIEREAVEFDETKVNQHLASLGRPAMHADKHDSNGNHHEHHHGHGHGHGHGRHGHSHGHGGCPGSAQRQFQRPAAMTPAATADKGEAPSELTHWPVQLMLIPPHAPFLQGAEIVLCADCVPFAFPDLHAAYLRNRAVLVGCPKLDDLGYYEEKLTAIFQQAAPKSVVVLRMEVPCCGGLVAAAQAAYEKARATFPLEAHIFGIQGGIMRKDRLS